MKSKQLYDEINRRLYQIIEIDPHFERKYEPDRNVFIYTYKNEKCLFVFYTDTFCEPKIYVAFPNMDSCLLPCDRSSQVVILPKEESCVYKVLSYIALTGDKAGLEIEISIEECVKKIFNTIKIKN